jgi:hypothetical protein
MRFIVGAAIIAGSVAGWKMLDINSVLMIITGFFGFVVLLAACDD